MKPKVVIDNDVYRKVMFWIMKAQGKEVSGLGNIQVEKDGVIRVVSAMLLPQVNGATHTDIEPDAVCKAMFELKDSPGELKWWWHSHVMMNVFWSGTDMATIRDFGAGGWIVATVLNQKREVRSAFYSQDGQRTPWGVQPLFLDELTTEITDYIDPRTHEWEAEYAKNVTEWKPKVAHFPMTATQPTWIDRREHGSGRTASLLTGITDADWRQAASAEVAANRPKGMTKRQWKAIRRQVAELEAQSKQLVLSAKPELTDAHGFTSDEREEMALAGFEEVDIRGFVDQDMTPAELLELSRAGVYCQDLEWMLSEGWKPSDVMNMARGSADHKSRVLRSILDDGQADLDESLIEDAYDHIMASRERGYS